MSIVKSAKGEMVNFDLIKIKEQIAAAVPSVDVTRRKDFIENRLRRRTKTTVPIAPIAVTATVPEIAGVVKEDIIVKKAEVDTTQTTKKTKPKTAKTTTTTKTTP